MAESCSPPAVYGFKGKLRMSGSYVEVFLDDVGDRVQLETAEARVLAHNFELNDKKWLEKVLKANERIYGAGSSERIRQYMRIIWKEEMLK